MKTLIVGGNGFIGTHLQRQFKADVIDLPEDFRDWDPKKYDKIIFLASKLDFNKETFEYNYTLYRALQHYMKLFPKTHVIFTSSACVYGNNDWAFTNSPLRPQDPYGWSKMQGEQIIQTFKKYTILRLSNVYGKGGHTAIEKFLEGGNIIHGHGSQIRDFVPVEKVVNAIINAKPGIYNVSSGVASNINEIYSIFGNGKPTYDKKAFYGLDFSVLVPSNEN